MFVILSEIINFLKSKPGPIGETDFEMSINFT